MATADHPNKEDYITKIPAIKVLCHLGWHYLPPSEVSLLRPNNREVILKPILIEVLKKRRFEYKGQQYSLDNQAIEQIYKKLSSPNMTSGLGVANENIYDDLCQGITVSQIMPDGKKHQTTVAVIDFSDLSNNRFDVTEEFEVARTNKVDTRRPDIVCFINGLPLVVIEAKKPAGSDYTDSTVSHAISQQIRNQKPEEIPTLFAYSQLLLAINGSEGSYGTCKTKSTFWAVWSDEIFSQDHYHKIINQPLNKTTRQALLGNKPANIKAHFDTLWANPRLPTRQDELLIGLLTHQRLIDFIRFYLLFDSKKGKIAARYQQVFGIEAIIERISRLKTGGARESGVFWHTTGSGKSFSMVLLCKALLLHPSLQNCRILVVTDRIDLEKQLSKTFLNSGALGVSVAGKRALDAKAKVSSGKQLAKRISDGDERIMFSLINKFATAAKMPECYNPSSDIIVLVDEGHRGHGAENHERMKQALPNAAYIAFTGTPLLKKQKTTNKFGPIIHSYTMKRATDDGTVAPLLYEERIPELNVNEKAIDNWFDKITAGLTLAQKADLKRKYDRKRTIYSSEPRIELIAWDISVHFNENFKSLKSGLKGQLACEDKRSAVRYKAALDEIGTVTSRIVMSPPDSREGHNDVDESKVPEVLQWWQDNVEGSAKAYEDKVIEDFSTEGEPDILIVVDKLLTGFDEPRNAVLYIDKTLRDHNIIQAVARVNRLHEMKEYGLLIDYRGILKELDCAVAAYNQLEQQTLQGFEPADLEGLYSRIDTEYKKLPQLHQELLAVFGTITPKYDHEQYRQKLLPEYGVDEDGDEVDEHQKDRDDFLKALTAFASCFKVALSSSAFYTDSTVGETKIALYKQDLKFFSDIRSMALRDAMKTIDYSNYDKKIGTLVDKQVVGTAVNDPGGVYVVNKLGQKAKQQQKITKARNDAANAHARIKKTLEVGLGDNPYAKKVFSQMLNEVIAETEAMFDHPLKQQAAYESFEQKVNNRDIDDMPTALKHSKPAQAYYGVFKLVLGDDAFSILDEQSVQQWVNRALEVERVVNNAVVEHSLNPQNIESDIRKHLLPTLFHKLGLEKTRKVIDHVVTIVHSGHNSP